MDRSGARATGFSRRACATGLAVAVLSPGLVRAAHVAGSGSARRAIEAVLADSAAAWSRGDLAGFMRCYEDAPTTAYVSKGEVTHGFAAIHDMYAARFGGAPGAMGALSTTLIDFRTLGPTYALAHGRFALDRAGARASGVFTLVFHASDQGWRIISDHTS